jgi:hypothetical protein
MEFKFQNVETGEVFTQDDLTIEKIAPKVVGLAAGYGTMKIVDAFVDQIQPEKMGLVTKACWKLGTFGLSGVSAKIVSSWMEEQIAFVKALRDVITEEQEKKKEPVADNGSK